MLLRRDTDCYRERDTEREKIYKDMCNHEVRGIISFVLCLHKVFKRDLLCLLLIPSFQFVV